MGRKRREIKPEELSSLLNDPVKFVGVCWPHIKLASYQSDILYSLRDNVETYVHAANEVGKDFITSCGVIWFFSTRSPARVITSSSGETQLKSILWSEIKERISSSVIKFPFKLGTLNIKRIRPDGTECPMSYIIGHVTKSVENFQGHHLDHDIPRVMGVFDEASGVGDEFEEAASSWAHRMLVIGNPLNTINFFYRNCKRGDQPHPKDSGEVGLLRKVHHISCYDSPNVQLGFELAQAKIPGPYKSIVPGVLSYGEYVRRTVLWDKVKIKTRLHGHFFEGDSSLLYPPEWLDKAEQNYLKIFPLGYEASNEPNDKHPAAAMGVDTGAGRDLSCWTIINRNGLLMQYAIQTPDTMQIPAITIEFMAKYGIPANRVAFDAGGGGKQIADRLRELGHRVRTIFFGETPTPPKHLKMKATKVKEAQAERRMTYKNRRAEMYGLLREIMDPNFNDDVFALPMELYELRRELAILPYLLDSEGKMWMPPKDKPPSATNKERTEIITLRKLLGRSPDRADSLVLGVFALLGEPAKKQAGGLW